MDKPSLRPYQIVPLKYIHEVGLEDIFNEAPQDVDVYLKDIDPRAIFEILLELINLPLENTQDKEKQFLFGLLIKHESIETKSLVRDRLNRYANKQTMVSIFSKFTTLKFIEYLFTNKIPLTDHIFDRTKSDEALNKALSEKQGLLILKAYLAFNSTYLKKKKSAHSVLSKTTENEQIKRAKIQLVQRLEEYEIHGDNDLEEIIVQFEKAYMLFNFLESNASYNTLLKAYLKSKGLEIWEQYLAKTTGFTLSFLLNRGIVSNVQSGKEQERDIMFFDQFCFQDSFYQEENFRYLRKYPYLKLDATRYNVIFMRFAIQKIFRSLCLDLSKFSDERKIVSNFKSDLGLKFFEEYLFYKVIDDIFVNKGLIKVNGKSFVEAKIDGGPDYYIRNWDKIFIFECKDITMSERVKTSYDYDVIESDLKLKFVENEKGKNKAIKQLLSFINKLENIKEKFDPQLNLNKAKIYPVIVTQERNLDTTGVNKILSKWFEDYTDQQITDIDKSKIMPLTIINIDALILYKKALREKSNSFNKLIDEYHKGIRKAADGKLLYSFMTWLDKNFKNSMDASYLLEKLDQLERKAAGYSD
jgi:hypothetical protein